MNILIFDTATSLETVIISTDRETFTVSENVAMNHSADLFHNMEGLLQKAGITMKDIDAIAVGTGPGSFTGIRIAVSTARMLAQIHAIPLLGIKTHRLYAESISVEEPSQILIAFDAKKKRVFGALYRTDGAGSEPVEMVAPGDYSMETLISFCEKSLPVYTIGDGIEKYSDVLSAAQGSFIHVPGFIPDGERISGMTRRELEKDKGGNHELVVPFYARKSDAETARGK